MALNKVAVLVAYTFNCNGSNNAKKSSLEISEKISVWRSSRRWKENAGIDLRKDGEVYPLSPSNINVLQDNSFYISNLTQYLTWLLTSESDVLYVPHLTHGVEPRAPEKQVTARFCEHGNGTLDLLQEEEFLD